MRWPHQTDNLLSWCILQCCRPALAPDRRPRSPPHPSGSGRRPSSASMWRRPAEERGYFWRAEGWDGRKTQTYRLRDATWQVGDFWNYKGGFTERQCHLSQTPTTHTPGMFVSAEVHLISLNALDQSVITVHFKTLTHQKREDVWMQNVQIKPLYTRRDINLH